MAAEIKETDLNTDHTTTNLKNDEAHQSQVTSKKLTLGCWLILCYIFLDALIATGISRALMKGYLEVAYSKGTYAYKFCVFLTKVDYLTHSLGGYIADNFLGRTKTVLGSGLIGLNGVFLLFLSSLSIKPTNVMMSFLINHVACHGITFVLWTVAADQLQNNNYAYEKAFVAAMFMKKLGELLGFLGVIMVENQRKCTHRSCYQTVLFVFCVIRLVSFIFLILIQTRLRHVEVDEYILTRVKKIISRVHRRQRRLTTTDGEKFDKWDFNAGTTRKWKFSENDVLVAKSLWIHWPLHLITFGTIVSYYFCRISLPIQQLTATKLFKTRNYLNYWFEDYEASLSAAVILIIFLLFIFRPFIKAKNIFPTFLSRLIFVNIMTYCLTVYATTLMSVEEYRQWTPKIPAGYSAFYYFNFGPCDIDIVGIRPPIAYHVGTVSQERQSYFRMLVNEKKFILNLTSTCQGKHVTQQTLITQSTSFGHVYTISLAVQNSSGGDKLRILVSNLSYYEKTKRKKGFGVVKFVMSPNLVAAGGKLEMRKEDLVISPFREANGSKDAIVGSNYIAVKSGLYSLHYLYDNKSIDLNTIPINSEEVVQFAICNVENPKVISALEIRGSVKKMSGLWFIPVKIMFGLLAVFYNCATQHLIYVGYPPKTRAFGACMFAFDIFVGYVFATQILSRLVKLMTKTQITFFARSLAILQVCLIFIAGRLNYFQFPINTRL